MGIMVGKKIALIKHHYYTFTLQLGPALKKLSLCTFCIALYILHRFVLKIESKVVFLTLLIGHHEYGMKQKRR